MGNDELICIASACDDGTIDLHKIGDSYRARVEIRHNKGVIIIHAFTQEEAKDCLRSLKYHISNLKVAVQINLTSLQLKYLKMNKQDVLKLCNVTSETFTCSSPKLKLEGIRSQVERRRKILQQLLNSIVTKSHKQTHNKYILMWKKCWQELNSNISQDKDVYVELTTLVSGDSITCELIVVGEDVQKVESAISSVRKIDGSFKEYVITTDVMGVKILNEALKFEKIKINKDLIYHIEVTTASITIVSPYCMHAEEIHKTIETFICLEKEKRKIVSKLFTLKYSFLFKKLKSQWNKIQEIAKSNKILSINLVTDPCLAIEVKGNEVAIKQAEPHILEYALSLESDVTCSDLSVDYYSRPALASPELLQLCNELESDLPVLLTLQVYPEVLTSAIVQINDSGIKVEVCDGSISLDNSEVIVNFTDVNLTLCDALKAVVSNSAVCDCKHHIASCGSLPPGKAINICRSGDGEIPVSTHAVMPNWINGNCDESYMINSAVIESLKLAAKSNLTSVSMPFLSRVDKDIATS